MAFPKHYFFLFRVLLSLDQLASVPSKDFLFLSLPCFSKNTIVILTMLAYKAIRKGKHLIKVDRWFPSSKMCIACGNIYHELTISDRTYLCPKCGHVIDRDYQAALNIDKMGFQMFLESIKAA